MKKNLKIFFWKFKIFEKNFWKILPNFIQIYQMYAPPLGTWIMKIWAFEFKIFWKFLKTRLAIFWTEYAINTKNVVCHVFSESRPTYFWLDELNPWLPNLLYCTLGWSSEKKIPLLKIREIDIFSKFNFKMCIF